MSITAYCASKKKKSENENGKWKNKILWDVECKMRISFEYY